MAWFKSHLGHFLAVTLGKLMTLSKLHVQNAEKDSTWHPGWSGSRLGKAHRQSVTCPESHRLRGLGSGTLHGCAPLL